MAEFQKITLEQVQQWEDIRERFREADVYYTNGYVRGLALHGDGNPIMAYYSCDGLEAVNVVMKRDIADFKPLRNICSPGQWYDSTTPYGYGGMLLQGENISENQIRQAAEAYTRFCVRERIIDEFVRFHPLNQNAVYGKYFYDLSLCGPTVAIPLHSEEEILSQMKPTHRNRLRKSMKLGIQIRFSTDLEDLSVFRSIYEETMQRDNAQLYYYFEPEVYETWFKNLENHIVLCEAVFEDEVIASAIMLYGNGRMHYHLGGTKTKFLSFSAYNQLMYEAAKFAFQHGCTQMHMGGGLGAQMDSLYQFKKKFAPKVDDCTFYIGRRVYNYEMYNILINARELSGATSYFPAYRLMEE